MEVVRHKILQPNLNWLSPDELLAGMMTVVGFHDFINGQPLSEGFGKLLELSDSYDL